jgi:trehalose utilization protein
MNTKTMLLLAITVGLFSAGSTMVFAQNDTATVSETVNEGFDLIAIGTVFLTFVAAGVFYATSGWIKKIRRKLAGDQSKLDWAKLGKTTLIGVILGVGAMIASVAMGEEIVINDAQMFFSQIGINSAAILFIDKWILGRSETIPPATSTGTGTTG